MKYLLGMLFLLPQLLWGQTIEQAEALVNRAEVEANTKTAVTSLQQAATIYRQLNAKEDYYQTGALMASRWLEQEEDALALEVASKFVREAERERYNGIPLSLLYKNIGKAQYNQYKDKEAREALAKALEIRENINPKDPELAKDYSNMGVVSSTTGRYNQAVKYLKKAIKLQKDEVVLANVYSEIGINYRFIGDFRKSLDYLNQSISILDKKNKSNESDRNKISIALATALVEKGSVLNELNQEGTDRKYIRQALEIFEKSDTRDDYNRMNCYRQLAISFEQFTIGGYHSADGLDSALYYYHKALKIAKDDIEGSDVIQAKLTMDLISVYTSKSKLEVADRLVSNLEKSEHLFEEKSLEMQSFYGSKLELSRAKNDWNTTLINTHKSLISLVPDYMSEDIYKNPTIEQLKEGISQNNIQNALALKARILYQDYQKNKNQKGLVAALETMELFDGMINQIRADFANSGSNIAWSDLTLDAYENAIEICLGMYAATQEEQYKEKAFYYSEKSKGLTLLEAFQNTKAEQIEGVDLEAERELKLDIADLEQVIFQLQQDKAVDNEEEIKALKKEVFLKREGYNEMIAELEAQNPAYYQTKYKMDIMDVAAVRQLLQPNQALIEYFVGDSAVYAFKITAGEFDVIKMSGQREMGEEVYSFREAIYGYFLNNRDRNPQILAKYATLYTEKGHQLYEQLIAPLGELPQRLVIIPAGAMCDMPFESLLAELPADPERFKTHAYLIKQHSINYAYSATLLKEMSEHEVAVGTETYLGFAPSFGEGASSVIRGKKYSLAPLTYNSVEVKNIQKLLGEGQIYEGEEATEDQFKKLAGNYSIIHFATHGLANNQDPDYSLLAFTEIKDEQENEFLYVSDMYNMELNAELVVLSACETALGKNFRGEGIMSLARGFSYAGAKSIFTTLWSVNDQATFQIVERFYKNLQDGLKKDEALQQAKLDFIENGNDLTAHPFLWSPYIMIGDTDELDSISSTTNWVLVGGGLGALVLLLIGGIFVARRKN
jgi:CHAT domain-containing protein/tetratricopeptide (TPR) repeat protein